MQYNFPKGFYWGGASSALQTEGTHTSKGRNIFDTFYEKEPTRFFNEMGPGILADFYHNYKADIKLLKDTGSNSHRTSISWSRLIPTGNGEVDKDAVDYYNDVIDTFKKNGIELFMNLVHFDMPEPMQELGGFESREVVEAYVRYAGICFDLFGKKVKNWCTFNEPIVTPEGGYLYDFHYPNVVDFKRAVQVGYNMIIAHAKAIEVFRQKVKDGKIYTTLNITPVYSRSENLKDLAAAEVAELLFVKSFLDPMITGEFNQKLIAFLEEHALLPQVEEGDLDNVRQNIMDYVGLNYYQPRRVKAKETAINPEGILMPESFFDNYDMQGKKMNTSRGWEIYPKAIYDMLMTIKNDYNNFPCFIAENGMGIQDEHVFRNNEGMIEDDYRIKFFKDHLKYVHQAIEEGSKCFGYHIWTPIDNWSMINEYKNRYGIIELNLDTGVRQQKKSGYWFKTLSENNGFDD